MKMTTTTIPLLSNLIQQQYTSYFGTTTGHQFDRYFGEYLNNAGVGGIDEGQAKNLFAYNGGNNQGSVLLGSENTDLFHGLTGVNSLIASGAGNDKIHVGIQDKSHNNFIYDFDYDPLPAGGDVDTLYLDGIKNFNKNYIRIAYKAAGSDTGQAYYDVWYNDGVNQKGSVAKIFTADTSMDTNTIAAIKERIKPGNALSAAYYDASITNPGNAWAGTTTVYNNEGNTASNNYAKITLQANTSEGTVEAIQLNELEQLLKLATAGFTTTKTGNTVTIDIGPATGLTFDTNATQKQMNTLKLFGNTKLVLNTVDNITAQNLDRKFKLGAGNN
jgi:hypothetical protein